MKKSEITKLANLVTNRILLKHNINVDHTKNNTKYNIGVQFVNDVKWHLRLEYKGQIFWVDTSNSMRIRNESRANDVTEDVKLSLKLKMYKMEEEILEIINKELKQMSKQKIRLS